MSLETIADDRLLACGEIDVIEGYSINVSIAGAVRLIISDRLENTNIKWLTLTRAYSRAFIHRQ